MADINLNLKAVLDDSEVKGQLDSLSRRTANSQPSSSSSSIRNSQNNSFASSAAGAAAGGALAGSAMAAGKALDPATLKSNLSNIDKMTSKFKEQLNVLKELQKAQRAYLDYDSKYNAFAKDIESRFGVGSKEALNFRATQGPRRAYLRNYFANQIKDLPQVMSVLGLPQNMSTQEIGDSFFGKGKEPIDIAKMVVSNQNSQVKLANERKAVEEKLKEAEAEKKAAQAAEKSAKSAMKFETTAKAVTRGLLGLGAACKYASSLMRQYADITENSALKKTSKTVSGIGDILVGAGGGAMLGKTFGPWGLLIGGIIGAIVAGFKTWGSNKIETAAENKKMTQENIEIRRNQLDRSEDSLIGRILNKGDYNNLLQNREIVGNQKASLERSRGRIERDLLRETDEYERAGLQRSLADVNNLIAAKGGYLSNINSRLADYNALRKGGNESIQGVLDDQMKEKDLGGYANKLKEEITGLGKSISDLTKKRARKGGLSFEEEGILQDNISKFTSKRSELKGLATPDTFKGGMFESYSSLAEVGGTGASGYGYRSDINRDIPSSILNSIEEMSRIANMQLDELVKIADNSKVTNQKLDNVNTYQ